MPQLSTTLLKIYAHGLTTYYGPFSNRVKAIEYAKLLIKDNPSLRYETDELNTPEAE